MNLKITAPFSLIFLTFAVTAQTTSTDAEKAAAEKLERRSALIERIVADAAEFRLAENRAFVYAKAGSLICRSDREAAQALFQRSVSDLLEAQMVFEPRSTARGERLEFQIARTARPVVLALIAGCDAPFALESLFRTRTPMIQRAVFQAGEPAARVAEPNSSESLVAQSELRLEQNLMRHAAEQNPELAVKLLQDSIRKGVSPETLNLLRKLHEKDPVAAAQLGSETIDRLLSANLGEGSYASNAEGLTNGILSDHIRPRRPDEKTFRFPDQQVRSLASKYITFMVGRGNRLYGGALQQLIKIAETLSPGNVALLKRLERENTPREIRNVVPDAEGRRLIESRLPPAQLVAEARKLPAESRGPVYQAAANGMAAAGDLDGALSLLSSNLSGRALENAVANVNSSYAHFLGNQQKWAEAERMIDQMPEERRPQALMTLARQAHAKAPTENREYSAALLNRAASMLPERPDDQNSLAQFVQLTIAYAEVEPEQAFRSFQPVIELWNVLSDANAVVRGFQESGSVRNGEFVLLTGINFGFQMDHTVIRILASADFDQTMRSIDTVTRRELRTSLRFQVIESVLK